MNKIWCWLTGRARKAERAAPESESALWLANANAMAARGRRLADHLGVVYDPNEMVPIGGEWLGVVPILEKLLERIETLESKEPPRG